MDRFMGWDQINMDNLEFQINWFRHIMTIQCPCRKCTILNHRCQWASSIARMRRKPSEIRARSSHSRATGHGKLVPSCKLPVVMTSAWHWLSQASSTPGVSWMMVDLESASQQVATPSWARTHTPAFHRSYNSPKITSTKSMLVQVDFQRPEWGHEDIEPHVKFSTTHQQRVVNVTWNNIGFLKCRFKCIQSISNFSLADSNYDLWIVIFIFTLIRFGLKTVRDSRDHFLSLESLLMRKMPAPWDLPQGFIIQVLCGFFRYSSTNML